MQLQDVLFSQGFGTRRVCCGLIQQGLVQVGEDRQPCNDPTSEWPEDGLVFWVQGEREFSAGGLEFAGTALNSALPGLHWFRRGFGHAAGHVEVLSPR